jgi:hypothetical protein
LSTLLPSILGLLVGLLFLISFGTWALNRLTNFVKRQIDDLSAKPIQVCSLPSPSLKPACSGVELPAQSFCHAHCWNLPLCCSEPCTWSPCYWTPRLIGENQASFPCFIIVCGTVKLSFDQNACLSCISLSRHLAPLLFQVSKMPFQARTHVVICWPDTTQDEKK